MLKLSDVLLDLAAYSSQLQGEWLVRQLGLMAYCDAWQRMRDFTLSRDDHAADELWVVAHPPVFTLGQAGLMSHLLKPVELMHIDIVKSDRGGQITYHAPGQLIVYILCDLRRKPYWAKEFVWRLEHALIDVLQSLGLNAQRVANRPGVYVDKRKIAALGLKVSQSCTYHGLALNVDLDLTPFSWINPCGYADLSTTSLRQEGVLISMEKIAAQVVSALEMRL